MMKSRITKSGMINFPAALRKKMGLDSGDEVSFLETPEGVMIIPVRDLFDLTNPEELPVAIEIIAEVREERRKEGS